MKKTVEGSISCSKVPVQPAGKVTFYNSLVES